MQQERNINPFKSYRAELTPEEFFQYFVEPHYMQNLIGSMPVIIKGERGTGKTTLLKYLTYYNQKNIYKDSFSDIEYVGVYWKVDINYVSAFYGKDLDENQWIQLFGHYLSITFCIELCRILVDMKVNHFITFTREKQICINVIRNFYEDKEITTYEQLLEFLSFKLMEIERYINNMTKFESPILSMLERPFTSFCTDLNMENQLSGKSFYFLIDEYENLLEYQQKIVNTLIKHSTLPYTYKICLRHEGQKTKYTLNEVEYLTDPADYSEIDLTKQNDSKKYIEFVKKVCNKRLMMISELNDKGLTDISFFLKGLSIDEEAKRIEESTPKIFYKKEFKEIIDNDTSIIDKKKTLEEFLACKDIVLRRLCLCILQRGKINAANLLTELRNHLNGKPSKFTAANGKGTDWLHNYKVAILYLLCHETSKKKIYCGFDTFIELSSGVIRYFIELCNVTFMFAFSEGYTLLNPVPFEFEIQDQAARYVAEKRFHEIDTYPPYGSNIKNLVFCIGNIFSNAHKDPKQSEPERNQFSIKDNYTNENDEIANNIMQIIKYAIMWGVLRGVKKSTKNKTKFRISKMDYYLNPIYSPYFDISYRKGRKIDLNYDEVESLLLKSPKANERIMKRFIKEIDNDLLYMQENMFYGSYLEGNEGDE